MTNTAVRNTRLANKFCHCGRTSTMTGTMLRAMMMPNAMAYMANTMTTLTRVPHKIRSVVVKVGDDSNSSDTESTDRSKQGIHICDICDMAFNQASNMRRHHRTIHGNNNRSNAPTASTYPHIITMPIGTNDDAIMD